MENVRRHVAELKRRNAEAQRQARAELKRRLQTLTEFPVDLRDLDSTPEFRELIEFYGEVLYARPRRFARITHGRGMVGGCSEAGEGGAQEVSL